MEGKSANHLQIQEKKDIIILVSVARRDHRWEFSSLPYIIHMFVTKKIELAIIIIIWLVDEEQAAEASVLQENTQLLNDES